MTQSFSSAGAFPARQATQVLTVEHLLYAAILLAAIGVRFVGLADAPLAPDESAASWSAWLAATQTTVAGAPVPASALLYGMQSLLFWIAGSSDFLARVVPALASTAMVVLPWFWRAWLGRWVALTVALLFAVDPWLTAWGRRADGSALAILLGLLAITAIWHWRYAPTAEASRRWVCTGAVALGLLLASGPLAWGMLPIVLIFAAVYVWSGGGHSDGQRVQANSLIWFGIGLALGATGLALRPEAVGALSTSISAWFTTLAGEAVNPAAWPFVRLVLDQPLLALFGPIGLVLLTLDARRRNLSALALVVWLWLAWALLTWLLPGRQPAVLPFAGLPLAISTGYLAGRVAEESAAGLTSLELFALLAIQIVLAVAGAIWLVALVDSQVVSDQPWFAGFIIIVLAVIVWVMYGFWAGWALMVRLAFYFYGMLLLMLTVRSTWQLNQVHGLMQPDGFWPASTSPELRLLVEDVERLSSARRGDPNQADVLVVYDVAPDPVMGWYLRDMRALEHVRGIDASTFQAQEFAARDALRWPLIVAPTTRNDALVLPNPYIGSDYGDVVMWDIAMLPQLPTDDAAPDAQDAQRRWSAYQRPLLRWFMYRKIEEPPTVQSVTLWAAR